MPAFIHQPHDKLFKMSMEEIAVAQEFFQTYLPQPLLARMDFQSLKLEKQSFIDEVYKTSEADIIYSVRIADSWSYLYILCEHQSTVDRIVRI